MAAMPGSSCRGSFSSSYVTCSFLLLFVCLSLLTLLTLLTTTPHPRSIALPSVFLAAAAASTDDFVIGALLNMEPNTLDAQSLIGLKAALLEQNAKGGVHGRNVSVELPGPASSSVSERQQNFFARSRNFTAVVTASLAAQDRLGSVYQSLPIIAPHASHPALFSPAHPNAHRIFHLQQDMLGEVFQLLNFALRSDTTVRFFAIVHDSLAVPPADLDSVLELMHRLHLPPPLVVKDTGDSAGTWSALNKALPNMSALITHAKDLRAMSATDTTNSEVGTDDPEFWSAARQLLPQGLILLTAEGIVRDVINQVMSHDERFAPVREELAFFVPWEANRATWRNATNHSSPYRHLYHVEPNPHYDDVSFLIVQQYRAAMADAWKAHPDTVLQGFTQLPYLQIYDAESFAGYIAGRFFLEVLSRVPVVTPSTVRDAIFRTKIFQLGDLTFGPFSEKCVGQQSFATGACWCTKGIRQFFMTRVNGSSGKQMALGNKASRSERDVAAVALDATTCSFDMLVLRPQAHVILPSYDSDVSAPLVSAATALPPSDAAISKRQYEAMQSAIECAIFAARYTASAEEVTPVVKAFHLESSTVNFTMRDIAARYNTKAIVGGAASEVHAGADTAFNMIAAKVRQRCGTDHTSASCLFPPRLVLAPYRFLWPETDPAVQPFAEWATTRLHIPVYPVLLDFIDTAVEFALHARPGSAVHVVADTASLVDLTRRVLLSVNHDSVGAGSADIESGTVCEVTDAAAIAEVTPLCFARSSDSPSTIAPSAKVIIVASQRPVVLRAAQLFAKTVSNNTVVVIATSEFLLEEVRDPAAASEAAHRLLFASGLPHYKSGGNATLAYAAFLTELVVKTLSGVPASSVAELLYSMNHRIETPTASLSPLDKTACPAEDIGRTERTSTSTCQCSKGLNTFHLRQLDHWNTSSSLPVFSHTHRGCGAHLAVKTLDLNEGATTYLLGVLIAGPAIAVLFVGVTAAFLWLRCTAPRPFAAKSASNAPQDPTTPLAMVFTDIQCSTKLWARAPTYTTDAIATHHRLMREVIVASRGYEVKTIGDAFMVAFKRPIDALQFAVDVQRRLHAHDWGTTLFDEVYLDEETRGPQTPAVWNGIRVRIGIAYGVAEVREDDGQLGFDYYGSTVNRAARLEALAHGGQIIVGATFAAALGDAFTSNRSALLSGSLPTRSASIKTSPTVSSGVQDRRLAQLGIVVQALGPQQLRGFDDPEPVFQVLPRDLSDREFPPLRVTVDNTADISSTGESERSTSFLRILGLSTACDDDMPVVSSVASRALSLTPSGGTSISVKQRFYSDRSHSGQSASLHNSTSGKQNPSVTSEARSAISGAPSAPSAPSATSGGATPRLPLSAMNSSKPAPQVSVPTVPPAAPRRAPGPQAPHIERLNTTRGPNVSFFPDDLPPVVGSANPSLLPRESASDDPSAHQYATSSSSIPSAAHTGIHDATASELGMTALPIEQPSAAVAFSLPGTPLCGFANPSSGGGCLAQLSSDAMFTQTTYTSDALGTDFQGSDTALSGPPHGAVDMTGRGAGGLRTGRGAAAPRAIPTLPMPPPASVSARGQPSVETRAGPALPPLPTAARPPPSPYPPASALDAGAVAVELVSNAPALMSADGAVPPLLPLTFAPICDVKTSTKPAPPPAPASSASPPIPQHLLPHAPATTERQKSGGSNLTDSGSVSRRKQSSPNPHRCKTEHNTAKAIGGGLLSSGSTSPVAPSPMTPGATTPQDGPSASRLAAPTRSTRSLRPQRSIAYNSEYPRQMSLRVSRASRDLAKLVERTARRLHLRASPAALLFAYRVVEVLLSTTKEPARQGIVDGLAKRWRAEEELPEWMVGPEIDEGSARMGRSRNSVAPVDRSGERYGDRHNPTGKDKEEATRRAVFLMTVVKALRTLEAMDGDLVTNLNI